MELVALALPSKRTERGGILMTCGVHRKPCPSTTGRPRPLPAPPKAWIPVRRRSKQGRLTFEEAKSLPETPAWKGTCHMRTVKLASVQVAKYARRHKGSRRGRCRSTSVGDVGCSVTRTRRSCILVHQSHSGARTAPYTTAPCTMFPLPDTRSAGSRQTADSAAHRGRCALPCNPPPI